MTKTKKQTKDSQGQTVTFKATAEVAKREFRKSVAKAYSENLHTVETFLLVMDYITNNMASFDESQVILYAKPYDLPTEELQRLFRLWSEKMESLGKLQIIAGVYDRPVYLNT